MRIGWNESSKQYRGSEVVWYSHAFNMAIDRYQGCKVSYCLVNACFKAISSIFKPIEWYQMHKSVLKVWKARKPLVEWHYELTLVVFILLKSRARAVKVVVISEGNVLSLKPSERNRKLASCICEIKKIAQVLPKKLPDLSAAWRSRWVLFHQRLPSKAPVLGFS